MANILKIDGTLTSTQVLGANPRFYSEKQDHLDPGTNITYEIISARINNDLLTSDGPDLNISVGAKFENTAEQEATTEFCKIEMGKARVN